MGHGKFRKIVPIIKLRSIGGVLLNGSEGSLNDEGLHWQKIPWVYSQARVRILHQHGDATDHLWYRLASMERYVRYYELLYKRYRIHRFVSKGMIGVGSTGLLSVFLSGVDSALITHGLAIGLAGDLRIWDLQSDRSEQGCNAC